MSKELDNLNKLKMFYLHYQQIDNEYLLRDSEREMFSSIEDTIKALDVAGKVFRYNSLSMHHIDSTCEEGYITEEERKLLKSKVSPYKIEEPTEKQINFIKLICMVLYDGEHFPTLHTKEQARQWISDHIDDYKREAETFFEDWSNYDLN